MSILKSNPALREPTHIPALDGVRGLAILLVMLSHFTVLAKDSKLDAIFGAAARFGWVGVDLFFVLSGFLITGILLNSKQHVHFFRNFYMRRVLRIFPLYYLVVFLGTVVLPFTVLAGLREFQSVNHGPWRLPFGYSSDMPHWPFYWLYFANFPIVFTRDVENSLLAVTWSLAIEEQFYLVWPLVVWLCTPAKLKRICLGVLSVSLLSRVVVAIYIAKYGNPADNHRISYQFTLCRLDGISLGSLLAIILHTGGLSAVRTLVPRTRWLAPIAVLVVLGSMAHARRSIIHEDPFGLTIGYTAIAILFVCTMIWVLTSPSGGLFNRLFTQKWLIFLGKYSYALYLCHLPIQTIVRTCIYNPENFKMIAGSKMPGQLIFYALCAVPSIAIALLSWHLIEKHFLRLKKHFSPNHAPEAMPASTHDDKLGPIIV